MSMEDAKGQESNSAKAAARRIKKRELDRKAQRLARERTKNRIQELESMVELLKADAFNPETSRLMNTLVQVTQQRDELQNVLQTIDHTIQRHVREQASSAFTPESEAQIIQPQHHHHPLDTRTTRNNNIDGTGINVSLGAGPCRSEHLAEAGNAKSTAHSSRGGMDNSFWQMAPSGPSSSSASSFRPAVCQATSSGIEPRCVVTTLPTTATGIWDQTVQALAVPVEQQLHTCIPTTEDIIVPRPQWPCDCVQAESLNTWRAANHALSKGATLSAGQLAIEDFTSEDTPVRAVLEGWDNVIKAGKMSLGWRKLRDIDRICFSTCGDVERLAILRIMHLLLTYHGDPSHERSRKVPRWLWTRPSQTLPHSYAIDFFVWPGLRERFVFAQHRYCRNLFWQLFRTSLKLHWPFELEDCYSVDPDTGRYVISPIFDQRIRDINIWRMTGDFFAQFPELSEDIPVAGSIAPSIGFTKEETMMAHRRLLTEKTLRRKSSDSISNKNENNSSDQDEASGNDDGGDTTTSVVLSMRGRSAYDASAVGADTSQQQVYHHQHHHHHQQYHQLHHQGIAPYPTGIYSSIPVSIEPECPWPSV